MALFTHILPDDDEDAGIHRKDFSNAISVWSVMQERDTTVADVAMAFNTTPELVRLAVEDHYWMSLDKPAEPDPTKQTIWHEGE